MKQKIKLCGMMRNCDIVYANEAMPDYVGFIFADTRRKVTASQAEEMKSLLHRDIRAVGVFVDADPAYVTGLSGRGIIDVIQLHGHEDTEYIRKIREMSDCPVIKAVKVTDEKDIIRAAELDVDYLLLDAYRKGIPGGTGEQFDWDIIERVRDREQTSICDKPFFLAGGINLYNLSEAAAVGAYGLDISTGIETDGYKDREKMIEAVRLIRQSE